MLSSSGAKGLISRVNLVFEHVGHRGLRDMTLNPESLNPKPSTLNPKP